MILLIDGSGGVDGERLLAALVDAGLPVPALRRVLARLPEPPAGVRAQRAGGSTALELRWRTRWPLTPQPAAAIVRLLTRCGFPSSVWRVTRAILKRLIWAEARAHRCALNDVMLHQISSPRSLAHLVGVSAAFAHFRIGAISATPLLIGARSQDHQGRWRRRVAPAVSVLMAGYPVLRSARPVEYTSPMGAAIITGLARQGLPRGVMSVAAQGCGRRSDQASLATRIFLIDRVLRIQ